MTDGAIDHEARTGVALNKQAIGDHEKFCIAAADRNASDHTEIKQDIKRFSLRLWGIAALILGAVISAVVKDWNGV